MNIPEHHTPSSRDPLGTLIVGAGPAGFGILMAARQCGLLNEFLSAGVRILERTAFVGPGEIGDYTVRSDSLVDRFLGPLEIESDYPLRSLLNLSAGAQLHALRGNPIHLAILADFLTDEAIEFRRQLAARNLDPVDTGIEATRAIRQKDGSWVTICKVANNGTVTYRSRTLVLATGAHQPVERLAKAKIAGSPLLPRFAAKTIQSSEFLSCHGMQRAEGIVGHLANPRIAIVGGSHSAISSAYRCIYPQAGVSFDPACVTVLHRSPLRLTYASPRAALADGFADFGPDDICPKSGRVFPLAGFRCDSRDLLRRYWGLGGLPTIDTLRLLRLQPESYHEANQVLEDADLIIAALGYQPRALPLFDAAGNAYKLQADTGAPLVDGHSHVLDAQGIPIPGVFALGLAAGYPLAGAHGEISFTGQANGLALWQTDVGIDIVRRAIGNVASLTAKPPKDLTASIGQHE